MATVYEFPPSPVKEVFSYSKGVQTTEEWGTQTSRPKAFEDSDNDEGETPATSTPSKRLSRRERDREDELRENLRREIEEEPDLIEVEAIGGGGFEERWRDGEDQK